MKLSGLFILIIGLPIMLFAQNDTTAYKWELTGNVFYDYSKTIMSSNSPGANGFYQRQSIVVQPSFGHFITSNIEVLGDIRYEYFTTEQNFGSSYKTWGDRIGFAFGGSYNYRINQFMPFIAAKLGVSWSRVLIDIHVDSGWGIPEISFPDVIIGSRYFVSKDWAFVLSIEYVKTSPYSNMPVWNTYDRVLAGFGLSVFL